MELKLSEKAAGYAKRKHADTNHLYDGKPYEHHLRLVVWYARQYLYLIPQEDAEMVLAACWAHDVIEDARQTYNDVKGVLGKDVAEIVYAVTNEKGKTRSERANDKYYSGIKSVKYATFVKACDRLANIDYSTSTSNNMKNMYQKEHKDFCAHLEVQKYSAMFAEMEHLLYPHKRPLDLTKHI